MHFTTLFVLRNEKLENVSLREIEDIFCERFCNCCGETSPKYTYWCDWFQIGGRWIDMLKAKKGLHGEKAWCIDGYKPKEGLYSIVEIEDLTDTIYENSVYAIATKSMIYQKEDEKFGKLLDDINNKRFKGVIALIDCHD